MADLISEIGDMEIHRFCDEIQTADGFTYTVPPVNITSCDYSWTKKNGNVLIYRDATEKNLLVVDWKAGNLTLSECLDEVHYVPLSEGSCGPTDRVSSVKFIASNRTTLSPGTDTRFFNHTTPSPEVGSYPSAYLWFLLLLLLVPILMFCWCKWRTQILSHFRRLKRFCCGGTGQDNRPNHAGMRADHTNITMLPNVTEINGGPNPRNNHYPKLNHADMSADLTNSPMLLNGTDSNGGPNPLNNNHPGEE